MPFLLLLIPTIWGGYKLTQEMKEAIKVMVVASVVVAILFVVYKKRKQILGV